MKNKIKFLLANIEEIVCGIALIITILTTLINIITGWIFGTRYGELQEFAILGFVWVTFAGIGIAYKHNAHICIDFFVTALPPKIRKTVILIVDLFLILFNLTFIYYAWQLALNAYVKTTSLTGIPYFYVDISVIIGFSFMTIYSIIGFIRAVKNRAVNL